MNCSRDPNTWEKRTTASAASPSTTAFSSGIVATAGYISASRGGSITTQSCPIKRTSSPFQFCTHGPVVPSRRVRARPPSTRYSPAGVRVAAKIQDSCSDPAPPMPHSATSEGSVRSNSKLAAGNESPNNGSLTVGVWPRATALPRKKLQRPAINNEGRLLGAKRWPRPEAPLLDEIGDPLGAIIALHVPVLGGARCLDHGNVAEHCI
jgi:hypothetical protein